MLDQESFVSKWWRQFKQRQKDQRIAAESANAQVFRRLERRRVLSVTGVFNVLTGVLDVSITAGGNTAANLLDGGAGTFFLDADNDSTFDGGEATGLMTALRQVNVDGGAFDGGSFFWRDNFLTAPLDFVGPNVVNILNINSASFEGSVATAGNVAIDVNNSFSLSGSLDVTGNLTIGVTGGAGTLTNAANASLDVSGLTTLSSSTINLGNQALDSINLDSLSILTSGTTSIATDSDLTVTGASATNTLGINSLGSITLTGAVSGNSGVTLFAQGLDHDVQINAGISTTTGNVSIQAGDSVLFGAAGSVTTGAAGTIGIIANVGNVVGDDGNVISMADGSSILAGTGTISLSSLGTNGGDILFSRLTTSNASATAVQISTSGDIIDNTAAETANITAASGTIVLQATGGSIGSGILANDIDINSARLIFNASAGAAGVVQITALAGGLIVSGSSVAGGGGFLAANSPLTISSSITVGASMTFTAGNSALAGDNITIDSGAVVTLTSAVSGGVLTFNAGDDIIFNTGQVITNGGGVHSVVLAADLDNAGVGAADGDRGGISQNGTAIVEVTTDLLIADAAVGIDLDTTIVTLDAANVSVGDIVINETNAITLLDVTTTNGSITVTAAGAITATSVNAGGAGSNADLATTTGGITVTSVIAANNVVLNATAGNITSGVVTATAGLIDIDATTGDVTLGTLTAGSTVNVDAPAGSIIDGNGAALNITATTATLNAANGIGSGNSIETNITQLEASNTTAGTIEITEVAAGVDIALGAVSNGTRNVTIISAAGAITDGNAAALNITAGIATLSAVNGIGSGNALETNITQLEASNTTAGTIEITELLAGGDIALGTVDNGLRNVSITANGGAITDGNGAALNITAGTATLTAVNGIGSGNAIETNITLLVAANTTAGTIEISEIAAGGDIALGVIDNGTRDVTIASSAGAITDGNGAALNITAGTATLTAVNGIGSGDAIETNITQLEATNTTAGTIEIVEVAAGGDIALGVVNNGTRDVTINSTSGAITDGNAAALNITAGIATLTAVNGIGSGNAIETNITQLEATNTTAGTIEITEVAAGGDIALGTIDNGTRDVTIASSAGAITDGNGAALNITAGTATLTAVNGIGSGDAIETNITQLDATNTTAGTIEIVEVAAGGDIALGVVNNGTRDVTITSTSGAITDGNAAALNITAGIATLSAVNGIGSGNAIETNITQLEATNTTAGTIEITEVAAGGDIALGTIDNGTRDVTIASSAGAITDGNGAALNITAGTATLTAVNGIGSGDAIETNITQLEATNTTAGTIEIVEVAAGGDIALGVVNNGTRDVTINSTSGAIADGNGAALNITAGTTTLTAVNGIGSGDAIETGITQLEATNSTAGTIEITEVAAGGDIALGLVSNLTRNVIITTLGGSITDGNGAAVNVTGLDVTLVANGGSIGGTSSDVFKGAFDPIEIVATGNLVATATAGAVAIDATVTGTTTVTAITGFIQSDGDLDINGLTLTVTNLGVIADADNNGAGTLTIGPTLTVTGDLRLQGADIVATDGTIDLFAARILFVSGAAETISVTTAVLDATTRGNLTVTSLAAAVDLLDLNCDNVALQTTVSAGSISFTSAGTVTVSDDVIAGNDGTTTSSGSMLLRAIGAASDIVVNDVVLTDNGGLTIRADNDVRFGGPFSGGDSADTDNLIVATTVNGNILIEADANLDTNDAGGEVFMADGSRIIAGRDVATDYVPGINGLPSPSAITLGATVKTAGLAQISMRADESITVGSVQTANNTVDAIRVVTRSGAIVDGGDAAGEPDFVANNAGALTTLLAVAGIGNGNALETSLFAVDANNTDALNPDTTLRVAATGNVQLSETVAGGDLNVVNANNNANTGDIIIQVNGGSMTVTSSAFAPSNGDFGVTAEAGDILLQASGDVVIDSAVTSASGHISVLAGDDVDQNADFVTGGTGSIFVQASNLVADAITGVDMASTASITTAGGNIRIVADNEGDILISTVNAGIGNVSLIAERSILDNNGVALNVTATALRMVADANLTNLSNQNGRIGDADTGNGTPGVNVNAIDTIVSVIAAQSADGIHISEANALLIGATGAIAIQQVNSDGTTTTVTDTSLSDLSTTNNGDIKLLSLTGTLTIDDGSDGDGIGVSASGSGNILLEARGLSSDVVVNANVAGTTGHITVNAGDDIDLNANVLTGGAGSVYLLAANGTLDAVGLEVDGINVNGTITTATGDILLDSARDIRMTSVISSTSGDVGLVATRDVLQSANVTTGGSVLVAAGRDFTMASGTSIAGGTNVLVDSEGTIRLGLISATNVSLDAVTDILDNNGGSVTNVRATNLRMVAGGTIGTADLPSPVGTNNNAIDTEVVRVAASAGTGVYIQEVVAGGSLAVDHVDAVTVTVDVSRVNFNSTTTAVSSSRTLGALDDVVGGGDVKLVAEAGTLTVNNGTNPGVVGVSGGGNILLQARGLASDVVVNANVVGTTGHITVSAGDDIDLNANVLTGGAGSVYLLAANGTLDAVGLEVDGINVNGTITTVTGDILLDSARDIRTTSVIASTSGDVGLVATRDVLQNANVTTAGNVLVAAGRDFTMALGTSIAAGTNVLVDSEGTIRLGLISATNVSLDAVTDILDNNGGSVTNVRATNLRMVAGGTIGTADLPSPVGTNNNAIDTEVVRVAASAGTGVYIQEVVAGGSLAVDHVDAVTVTVDVSRVNFNSTTTAVSSSRTLGALDDVVGGGDVKLVAEAGTLTVNNGTNPGVVGVSGGGNILLQARGLASDVVVNANVVGTTGHVTVSAGDDIDLNANVLTGGAGSVYLLAANGTLDAVGLEVDGINVNGTITTVTGDILLDSARDIRTTSVIASTSGDVGLVATRDALQNANVTTAGNVLVAVGRDFTMALGTSIAAGTNVLVDSEGTIRLGLISATNVSLDAVTDILDNNGGSVTNVRATNLRMVAGGTIGTADLISPVGTNNNAIDTEVVRVAASAGTGIYIQEVVAGGSLTVDHVNAVTVSVDVSRVNFNSTTTAVSSSRTLAALDDVVGGGNVKLVTEAGTLTVNDGTDGDDFGVIATGAGDVLLESRGTASDVVVNAKVVGTTGNVSIIADDDLNLTGEVGTGFVGTVYLVANNGTMDAAGLTVDGINIFREVATMEGDILLVSSMDIRVENIRILTGGDIGLVASRDVHQINAIIGGNVFVDAGRDVTMDFGASISGSNVIVDSGRTILLGLLNAIHVSLDAGSDILDGNTVAFTNIRATDLRMVAGGTIGTPDLGNPADVNFNAIEIEVDNVAASAGTGIYLYETNFSLTVDHVDEVTITVVVSQVNFNSTTALVSSSQTLGALDDLEAGGQIKVDTLGGTLTVNDGTDGDSVGVRSSAGGNILLKSGGLASDVVVNANVAGTTGHVTVSAGDDIDLNANVLTGGAGSVYLLAANGTLDAVGLEVDGINVNGTITTVTGDILLDSARDIRTTSVIASTSGDVGLVATRDVLQNANVTTAGNVLVAAGRDFTMALGTSIAAGTNVLVDSEGTIRLGLISATNVSLDAVTDILDNNGGSVTNVRATNLRMVAGGTIGTSDLPSPVGTNNNAIDTEVVRVAASAGTGVYIQEVVAGGSLAVDHVDAVTVTVDVSRVNFNSTTTAVSSSRTLGALDDVVGGGDVKLVAEAGTLTVNNGTNPGVVGVSGGGNILLQARGLSSDVVVNANVAGTTGHITVSAGDDIDLNAIVLTGGAGSVYLLAANGTLDAVGLEVDGINVNGTITTVTGDILLDSARDIRTTSVIASTSGDVGLVATRDVLQNANVTTAGNVLVAVGRDFTMALGTSIAAGTNVLVDSEGTIRLGLISATNVSLDAVTDILDNNGGSVTNVRATNLRMVAGGTIGTAADPLDTEVTVVAAQSANGIHLHEVTAGGSITVDHVNAVSMSVDVSRVNFNSTTSPIGSTAMLGGLDDLTTTVSGSIGVETENGSITVNEGDDNDAIGISAATTGTITLNAVGASSDVVINADANTMSGTGSIVIGAGDDIDQIGNISTAGAGAILLMADNGTVDAVLAKVDGINVNGSIMTVSGNIGLFSAANIGIGSVISTTANVFLSASTGFIDEFNTTAEVSGNRLSIISGTYAHLHDTRVNVLNAVVGSNGMLDSAFQVQNLVANGTGSGFLDAFQGNLINGNTVIDQLLGRDEDGLRETVAGLRDEFRFVTRFGGNYALYMRNTGSLNVEMIAAGSSDAPNIYIETIGAGSDLTISGVVMTSSTNPDFQEGGMVLIAGSNLQITPTGMLVTELAGSGTSFDQVIRFVDLNATFFDGGEGFGVDKTTTRQVLPDEPGAAGGVNFETHILQRVALQFGRLGEAGFLSMIGYADGRIQNFDSAGELGTSPILGGMSTPITAKANTTMDVGLLVREEAFSSFFLRTNQAMPTFAVVRRAADFFMFGNGGTQDLASAIQTNDSAVAADTINNVLSQGAGAGGVIPNEPMPDLPPGAIPLPPPVLIDQPLVPTAPPIELAIQPEKIAQVIIYRISDNQFEDLNHDGQVDEAELPSFSDVKESLTNSELVGNVENEDGGLPTQENIELAKQKLQSDPTQKTGAYAVIEKGINGEITVREVFSIRDWAEQQGNSDQTDTNNVVPIVPDPPTNDGTNTPIEGKKPDGTQSSNEVVPVVPGSDSSVESPEKGAADSVLVPTSIEMGKSRFSAGSLVAGSLWMLRTAHSRTSIAGDAAIGSESGSIEEQTAKREFSASARRRRRVKRQLSPTV